MLIPTTFEDILDNRSLIARMLKNGCARLPEDQIKYEHYKAESPRDIRAAKIHIEIQDFGSLLPNRFPYTFFLQFLPQVQHYVLWEEGELSLEQVNKIIADKFGTNRYFYYRNPVSKKSVLEIDHLQVFVEVV